MFNEDAPGWGLSLYGKDDEKYEQFLRLLRVAIPSTKAEVMAREGWTVNNVAVARIEELRRYTGDDRLSALWVTNAIKLLEQGL